MPQMHRIDLDRASASPIRPEVLEAMEPFFARVYGNPSSLHALGREARQALDNWTDRMAALVGRTAREVIFTGSATEAINQAILGSLEPGQHLLVSAIEHHAVLAAADEFVRRGGSLGALMPDADGLVQPENVRTALRPETALVAVMAANNEIGTIQPISALAAAVHDGGARLLTDAAQAPGALDLRDLASHADLLVLSAAKVGGPKGVGVLIAPEDPPVRPLIFGGGQQHRKRSGTENIAGIAGLVTALELAERERSLNVPKITALRERLLARLRKGLPTLVLHGHADLRLPGNIHLGISGIPAETFVVALDQEGVFASSGAACTAPMIEPSHVLRALQLPDALVRTGLRLSFDASLSEADIDEAADRIISVAQRL